MTSCLGKKPPSIGENRYVDKETQTHYRQALIEAADELDHECLDDCVCWYKKLAKKLRISAGVK